MYDEDARPVTAPMAGVLQTLFCLSQSTFPVPPLRTEKVALAIVKALEEQTNNNPLSEDKAIYHHYKEILSLCNQQ